MFFRWCHHCCCSKMARSCGYVFNVVKRGIWNPKHYLFFLPLKRKSQKARLWLMLTMSAINAGVTTGKTQIRKYSTTKNDCDDMQWIWLVGNDQSLWWKAVRQSQSAISQFVLERVQIGNYRNYTVKVLLLFHNQKTNSCNTFFLSLIPKEMHHEQVVLIRTDSDWLQCDGVVVWEWLQSVWTVTVQRKVACANTLQSKVVAVTAPGLGGSGPAFL